MNFLKKIRGLKKSQREIIFWLIIAFFIILFGAFFLVRAQQKIETFEDEGLLEEMGLTSFKDLFDNNFLPANIKEIIKEKQ